MTIKSESGGELERVYASKLLPIIKHHHLLLVTLMLWNASATEALPIFLNALVTEWVAILISVSLVLIAGEIVPASILTGPNQLKLTAKLAWLVWVVLFIFFPVAYPISLLLDWIIGHDEGITIYNKKELATMLRVQRQESIRKSVSGMEFVQDDEANILGGALTFRDTKVSSVMTEWTSVYFLYYDDLLNYKTIYDIFKSGFSRIPVCDRTTGDVVGLLLSKDLIFVDPEDEISVGSLIDLFCRKPFTVWHDQDLGETLNMFCSFQAHLAIVVDVVSENNKDPKYIHLGLITLEDIIEEILGTEIIDETDQNNLPDINRLRDMDLARLKSLSAKITDEKLNEDEKQALINFLKNDVPQVKKLLSEDPCLNIESIISNCTVHNINRDDLLIQKNSETDVESTFNEETNPKDGEIKNSNQHLLLRKGKISNTCIVILKGKVKLDNDVTIGPWKCINADALLVPEGQYISEHSVVIESSQIRFVRISTFRKPSNETSEGWSVNRKKKRVNSKGDDGVLLRRNTTNPLHNTSTGSLGSTKFNIPSNDKSTYFPRSNTINTTVQSSSLSISPKSISPIKKSGVSSGLTEKLL